MRIPFVLLALYAINPNPARAQDTLQLPLFDGALILTAEAGLRQDLREPDGALLDFWRPVTFGPRTRPIGGRMDCRLGGVRQPYSEALFDIRQRHRDARDARTGSGLRDEDSIYAEDGAIRRLEVIGHAGDPHRHYVLTYLTLRAEPYLYDIRLNCEFRHLEEPGRRTDYAAIMRQYVDIAVPMADTRAAPANPEPPDS